MRLQSAERWETLPGWARRFVLPACLLLAAAGVRSLLTRLIYPPGTFGIGSLSAWMDQAGVYARLQEFARFLRPFGLLHALALALVITRLLRRAEPALPGAAVGPDRPRRRAAFFRCGVERSGVRRRVGVL